MHTLFRPDTNCIWELLVRARRPGGFKSDFARRAVSDAEFIVLLSGIDETSSQSVHVRSSYKHDEVAWGAKFADMFTPSDGVIRVDLRKLHDIQAVE